MRILFFETEPVTSEVRVRPVAFSGQSRRHGPAVALQTPGRKQADNDENYSHVAGGHWADRVGFSRNLKDLICASIRRPRLGVGIAQNRNGAPRAASSVKMR